jgi:hypothetical protein
MELYILIFTLFLLQLADWYSTYTVIKNGGHEQNPVMAKLFNLVDKNIVLGIKAIFVTGLGYFIGLHQPLVLLGLVFFYIFIIIHNWQSL